MKQEKKLRSRDFQVSKKSLEERLSVALTQFYVHSRGIAVVAWVLGAVSFGGKRVSASTQPLLI